jgi:hypothetical protein
VPYLAPSKNREGQNWPKLGKTGKTKKDWERLGKTGKDWERLGKTGKNFFSKREKIYGNLERPLLTRVAELELG